MLKLALVLGALLICAGALQSGAPDASASSPVSMEVYPDSGKVQGAAGNAFSVYVNVNGAVTDAGGFEFDLLFDDAVISATSIEGFGYFDENSICVPTSMEGFAHLGCIVLGGPGVGGGIWAEIRFAFDVAYDGLLQFDLQDCAVADSDGDPIALNGCKGGTWTVHPEPAPVQMTMSPPVTKLQAVPGETVMVDAVISNVADFGAFEFNVAFDDTKLTLTNITEGPFLGSLGGDTVCIFTAPPTIFPNFGCTLKGKEGVVEGSGTIAHIEFTVKVPFTGTTGVSLADCEAADVQGFNVPVDECSGAMVQSNPTPTLSPTPTTTPFPVGGLSYDLLRPERDRSDAWPALTFAIASGAFVLAGVASLARRGASTPRS